MALDGRTGSHAGTAEEKAVIEDTVSYVNLVPGQKYVIRGKLLDKETGKALTAGGKLISAEREFTPESPSGIVMLTYELDSRELAGRTAAVYEELFCGEFMLASHGGPEDEKSVCPLSGDPHQRGGRQDGCAPGRCGKGDGYNRYHTRSRVGIWFRAVNTRFAGG